MGQRHRGAPEMIEAYGNDLDFVGFIESNSTDDFQFIRPSGNPANIALFKNMMGGDISITDHTLAEIHRLEVVGDMAFAAITETAVFEYKGTANDDRYTCSIIFKRVEGEWKVQWMHRSTGDQTETPTFDWSLVLER